MTTTGNSSVSPQVILTSIRLMSEAFFAFDALNRSQLKAFGLTPAQFDIIATLGNTCGLTFRELGQKTLITKGTLTGVVDRLSRMGLVERKSGQPDRRTIVVKLTSDGVAMFGRAYPSMLEQIEIVFGRAGYQQEDFDLLSQQLSRLRACFECSDQAAECPSGEIIMAEDDQ